MTTLVLEKIMKRKLVVRRENISEKQILRLELIDYIKTRRTQFLPTDLQSFLKKIF